MILWRNAFFWVSITNIAYFLTKAKLFSTFTFSTSISVERGKRGGPQEDNTFSPPSPSQLYVGPQIQAPILVRVGTGLMPPHIRALLVLCFVIVFPPFFFCSAAVFTAHFKLSILEFRTILLGPRYTLVNLLYADLANNANLKSEQSLQGWNRFSPVLW